MSNLTVTSAIDPSPYSCLPFVFLMLMMAFLPMAGGLPQRLWEPNLGKAAGVFVLSLTVWLYYCIAFASQGGVEAMVSQLIDWINFVCLIGSLYVVAGGLFCDYDDLASPRMNTLILLFGAVLTNFTGTTGACMILIRTFVHINKARLAPHHITFFIMIVGNISGVLTPLGDPPMFIGFLKGVPFLWMLQNPKIVGSWAMCVMVLLIAFWVHDRRNYSAYYFKGIQVENVEVAVAPEAPSDRKNAFRGRAAVFGFLGIVVIVFVQGLPVWGSGNDRYVNLGASAILVCLTLTIRYVVGDPECYALNLFNLGPLIEVVILFFGLFSTLAPVLGYLEFHATELNLNQPWQFFWTSGALSAVLDNAPTYLTFASLGAGLYNASFNDPQQVAVLLTVPSFSNILEAVSMGSVFFGACTYLGNAPNLMVKATVEDMIKREGGYPPHAVPNFLMYMAWVLPHLLPLFVIVMFIIGI